MPPMLTSLLDSPALCLKLGVRHMNKRAVTTRPVRRSKALSGYISGGSGCFVVNIAAGMTKYTDKVGVAKNVRRH